MTSQQQWLQFIKAEYQQYQGEMQNSILAHDSNLHQRILDTWRKHSPKMWRDLTAIGKDFPQLLAFVLQERMWRESQKQVEGGVLVTDAWEQAERMHLMLEPNSHYLDK